MIGCFENLREVTAVTKLGMAEDDIAYLHLLCLVLLSKIKITFGMKKSSILDEEKNMMDVIYPPKAICLQQRH